MLYWFFYFLFSYPLHFLLFISRFPPVSFRQTICLSFFLSFFLLFSLLFCSFAFLLSIYLNLHSCLIRSLLLFFFLSALLFFTLSLSVLPIYLFRLLRFLPRHCSSFLPKFFLTHSFFLFFPLIVSFLYSLILTTLFVYFLNFISTSM